MFVFTIIETIMYYMCMCITLHNVKDYIFRGNLRLIIAPVLYSILMVLNYLVTKDATNFISFFIILLFLLSSKFIFKNSKFSTIVIIFLLLYSIDIIVTSTITFILSQSGSYTFKAILGFILNIFFTVGFIIIIKLKHSEIQQCLDLISKKVKILTFLSLITSAFLLTIISEASNFTNIYKWNTILKIIISVFIIIVGAAFPILNINSYTKNYYMKQSENLENQFKVQADYYASLAKSNFELRQFRHDYNNMKIGISELIKEGKNNDALNMLDYCDNQLLSAISICKFDTGNNIVDALLTDKQEKANAYNTHLFFKGAISNKINPTDLCVIFGNALDNAIEACEKIKTSESKTIQINCECNGGFMFLTITNPVCKDIFIHNNTILTSKEDKESHGFGLLSINQVTKKHEGKVSLSCINKEFTISIDLCLL